MCWTGIYNLFQDIWMILHFLGGASISYMSILFLRFFKEERIIEIKNKFVAVFIIVSVVSLFAVFWEFYEYLADSFLGTFYQLGLEDTLLDLVMGLFGGISVPFLVLVFRNFNFS